MANENTASLTPDAPRPPGRPRPCALAVTLGPTELLGRVFYFDHDALIGRASDAEIHVDVTGVSRRHARLVHHEQGFDLIDLQSKNGTRCNGERITRHTLRSGDLVQVGGQLELRFDYIDQLDEDTQRQVFENATRDVLTGAVNRAYLLELLGREFGAATRYGNELSVIALEPEQLDALPAPQRPLALGAVARAVSTAIRAEDVLGRISSSQLAVVLRECGPAPAVSVVQRLRACVQATTLPGTRTTLTVRAGVASYDAGRFARAADLLALALEELQRPPS